MTDPEVAAARAWRESLDLSRAQLGAMIGYNAQSIYLIETRTKDPRDSRFRRYKAACLLVAILAAVKNPDLTVEKWTWRQNSVTTSGAS